MCNGCGDGCDGSGIGVTTGVTARVCNRCDGIISGVGSTVCNGRDAKVCR